jgi:DNA-binding GntR family transcriptional regulator
MVKSATNGIVEVAEKTRAREPAISAAEVAAWICTRIRRGRLVPGQRLVEADLVRETGASRTRIREAFQRLDSEGVLLIEEFRGASVRRFSWEELSAIYRTRSVLEGLAAGELAASGAPETKQRLAEVQRDLDAAIVAGDHDAFARANDEWHATIIEGSGNPYVKQFVDRLLVPASRLLFSTLHSRQRLGDANEDHRVITAAILSGDSELAEQRMRQHVRAGFSALAVEAIEE